VIKRKFSTPILESCAKPTGEAFCHGLYLVRTTDISINKIALQYGYLSQSRFTHKFKQRFGVNPSQFRKTLKDD
jgi:methylphosphotriester-DNA--protein-cysteine methyltransferase